MIFTKLHKRKEKYVKTNHNRMDWIEYFTVKKLLGEMIGA